MPYTENGIVPDIIVNPNGIPKRMSLGQLIECAFCKASVLKGTQIDGTPFRKTDVNDVVPLLESMGFKGSGSEILYNGKTGEQLESNIFIGPTFYYRLKHLVQDKIHSRSSGPYQNLTMQPAEGRSRDGGLRFGEMERDCFEKNTPINLDFERSIMIKNFNKHNFSVLSFNEDKEGLEEQKVVGFLDKGEREIIELRLQDGRTMKCTPDHPILTDKGWSKACDLEEGISRIKVNINYPLLDIDEDLKVCNNWSLKVGTWLFKTDTIDNYLMTLKFCRILGFMIGDGCIYSTKDLGTIYLGHKIDLKNIKKDLNDFNKTKQIKFSYKNKYGYYITLSKDFINNILTLKGILVGKKIDQEAVLPEFITNPDTPVPIIKEFLGGLFGADGHTCVLSKHREKRDLIKSVGYSISRKLQHIDSLQNYISQLKELLMKCGVENVSIQNPKETTASKKKENTKNKSMQLNLHIDLSSLIQFSENIGFRYCVHKSQRLEAGVCYVRLRNEVIRQHHWITDKVNEITNFKTIKSENAQKKVPTKNAIQQATDELIQKEGLLHQYAIPTTHDITDHLMKGTTMTRFNSKKFHTAEEFLEEIEAINLFNYDDSKNYGCEKDNDVIDVFHLKLISKRNAGVDKVYDISVENTHNFLANGVVAHNCMISHGTVGFLKERMFNCSDKYYIWVDKETGMISPVNPSKNDYRSLYSENTTKFAKIQIPYSSKLLFQELMSMGIVPRIQTTNQI